MNFEKSDALIGAFVLGAVILALLAAFAINRERFTAETYHMEIHLPNISGIDKGVEVMYQGYKAGAVDKVSISYEPKLEFIARLAIKTEIRLKEGTSVVVRNKGFGGAKFLELSVPAEDRPLLSEGAVLPTVRDTDLMAKANEVMGELERVVKGFQKEGVSADIALTFKHANLALAKLEATLTTLNGVLEDNRAALKATMHNAQGVAARTNDLLTKREAALQQSLENLNQSLAHLPSIMVNLEELTAELKRHPWRLVRKGEAGPPPAMEHKHAPAVKVSTSAPVGKD